MNNLITASEAFDALQNGFTVLCRPVGDMLEFSELDQFPATIFAKSGYEFCIKLETIELAGITFTKPLTIDEYKAGQDVFVSIHIFLRFISLDLKPLHLLKLLKEDCST